CECLPALSNGGRDEPQIDSMLSVEPVCPLLLLPMVRSAERSDLEPPAAPRSGPIHMGALDVGPLAPRYRAGQRLHPSDEPGRVERSLEPLALALPPTLRGLRG